MPFSMKIGPLAGVSALAITVAGNAVDGWSTGDAGSGPPMAPNATFSIVLETAPSPAVAPHDQWFTVGSISGFTPAAPSGSGNVFDPQAHDITWVWDFGDPGSVPHPSCNLPTAWRDTNAAYGKRVAHVFDGPGTYTVRCFAFDQDGHYGVATAEVTVADPATTYPGNRTICVNPAGDSTYTGAPSGSQQVNVAGLTAAIEAVSGQTCRILFKRGATYVGAVPSAFNHANSYYHAYGTGADPIIRPATDSDGQTFGVRGTVGNKFVGLDFWGRWDVETETGNYASFAGMLFQDSPILIHKCRIRDSDGLVVRQDVIYSASLIENWRGFALIDSGMTATSRYGIVGSALHMSADACQGQYNSFFDAKLGNQNGPIRISSPPGLFVSASSIFSNTGWSSNDNTALPLTQGNRQQIQSCMRLGEPSGFNAPYLNNIERVVCEGGNISLAVRNNTGSHPSNYILDKVILMPGADGISLAPVDLTGGTTMRNVLVWMPNVPVPKASTRSFLVDRVNNTNGAADRRVRVYGCTFYSALTSANQGGPAGSGADRSNLTLQDEVDDFETAMTDFTEENNVVHCPAQNVAITTAAPVEMVAIPGLTTLYRGPRWNFPPTSTTLGADVPNGGTVTFAYPDDTTLHPNGQETDQAYFLAEPGNGEHMLGTTGDWEPFDNLPRRSARGEFSVSFGASNITVTNTSGQTWTAGRTLRLLLDRRNDIGGPLTVHASPATVEVPLPIAGSPALAAAGVGLIPIDDLFGGRRPGEMRNNGAVVNGDPTRGARDPSTLSSDVAA